MTHSEGSIRRASGLFGIALGLGRGGRNANVFAQAFVLVYTLVALAGFANMPAFVVSVLNLNPAGNLIHLALGLLSMWVGLGAKQKLAVDRS